MVLSGPDNLVINGAIAPGELIYGNCKSKRAKEIVFEGGKEAARGGSEKSGLVVAVWRLQHARIVHSHTVLPCTQRVWKAGSGKVGLRNYRRTFGEFARSFSHILESVRNGDKKRSRENGNTKVTKKIKGTGSVCS